MHLHFQPKVPQPLKDLNYMQSQGSRSTEVIKNLSRDTMEAGKKREKITLTQYRERVKSKSPAKPVDDDQESEILERRKDRKDESKVKEMVELVNPGIREERAMSTDDIADVSVDLANMSIDVTDTYLDEKTGKLVENGKNVEFERVKEPKRIENRLMLKKSVSLTKTNEKEPVGKLLRADKSDSSLIVKSVEEKSDPENENDAVVSLPLLERIRMKSGDSQANADQRVCSSKLADKSQIQADIPAALDLHDKSSFRNDRNEKQRNREKILAGSPEVIDLTEDEESPEPLLLKTKNVQQKVYKDSLQRQTSPVMSKETFGLERSQCASFESLNKKPDTKVIPVPTQSRQWRDPLSGHAQDLKPTSDGLFQTVQADIAKRNELAKLLEKQKVNIEQIKALLMKVYTFVRVSELLICAVLLQYNFC